MIIIFSCLVVITVAFFSAMNEYGRNYSPGREYYARELKDSGLNQEQIVEVFVFEHVNNYN